MDAIACLNRRGNPVAETDPIEPGIGTGAASGADRCRVSLWDEGLVLQHGIARGKNDVVRPGANPPTLVAVNLNPALDRTVRVDFLRHEDRNPVLAWEEEAGGKAANVARAAQGEGIRVLVPTPLGGDAGRRYKRLAAREGLPLAVLPIGGETRVNETILQNRNSRQIRLNYPGPGLRRAEWRSVRHLVEEAVRGAGALVLCGSLPPGVPPGAYPAWVREARRSGVLSLVDADGDAFRRAVEARPDWVKPNGFELIRCVRGAAAGASAAAPRSWREAADAARKLQEMGACGVLVSLGARGAMLLPPAGTPWTAVPTRVRVVNTVGAGDVLAGVFVARLLKGADPPEAMAEGVAAATASVMVAGTARHRSVDRRRVRREVSLARIGSRGRR